MNETENTTNQEELQIIADLALDDALHAMNLPNEVLQAVKTAYHQMRGTTIEPSVLQLLAKGLTHDDDVKNAESDGYVRGKNEKIELINHFDANSETMARRNAQFPRYAKVNFWDKNEIN